MVFLKSEVMKIGERPPLSTYKDGKDPSVLDQNKKSKVIPLTLVEIEFLGY